MMKTVKHLIAAIVVTGITIATTAHSHAASIVKVNYSDNSGSVGSMIYTGSDGSAKSDRSIYWKLLGKAPERAYEVKIKPDQPGGKTATLSGKITVEIQIRNKINMGTVKTQKLSLIRDGANSTRWYLPPKELKRMTGLIGKKPTNIPKKYAKRDESVHVETKEIIRILEEEQIMATTTTHSQRITIWLKNGKRYDGLFVASKAGEPYTRMGASNVVSHIIKKRPAKDVRDWAANAEQE